LKITNRSKGVVLAVRAELAQKLTARMKGLLGRSSLEAGEGLVISPCSSIHTFGMRFPIDAVFFDREDRAVAVIRDLKPYRVSGWYPRARGVLELPAGTLTGLSLEVGDELEFSDRAE
jgi:uncharacterized membrane protein (UPF0127 family)